MGLSKFYKHGLSPLIFIGTLLVSLIIINYVVAVKTSSYDVTKNKKNTLSRETQNLLNDIDYEVHVKAFYPFESQSKLRTLFDRFFEMPELTC